VEAAGKAISHPLLEDVPIRGARGVLMNITATSDMEFEEVAEASEYIHSEVGEEAEIFWGTSVDEGLGDAMRVTVIATGIGNEKEMIEQPTKPQQQLRGKIRDITPEDLGKIVDYDEPTFIRQKRAVGESSRAVYRGTGGTLVNDNDLDVPTFLRRKAD
jgi:cell division protein FtsZ